MANILPAVVWMLILQTASMAAPSDDTLIEPKYSEEHSDSESLAPGKDDQSGVENENNQRQKRFYNYDEFNFSPFRYPTNFPPPLPFNSHFSKRDEGHNTGFYGDRDVLSQIHSRLDEILSITRRQAHQVPQQTPFPTFIPLLFIPQFGCGCSTNKEAPPKTEQDNNNSPPQPIKPTESTAPIKPTRPTEQFIPALPNRFNSMNDTGSNQEIDDYGNRPISFDPVIPDSPIDVYVPPVEHGSVQAGAQPEQFAPSTSRAILNSPAPALPIATTPPNINVQSRLPSIAPSACDAAIIRCCIGTQATPNCFEQNGCPDPSKYGKPCDPEVIFNLVNKVLHYAQQLGLDKTW